MATHHWNRRTWLKSAALGVGLGVTATDSAESAEAPLNTAERLTRVPTRKLGATGKEIPILLMGGSQKFDAKYDRRLHQAHKAGVTYIDTSIKYSEGQAHKSLAPFLQQVGRENVWLTSKVRLYGRNFSPEAYSTNLEKMLPDLETDHLDMFFMHAVEYPEQLDSEYIKMGEDIRKRGLAKHFGFSCHMGNVVELMHKAAKLGAPAIDCIMFRYNFATYGDYELNRAIDACVDAGIGLIAMKTQGSVPEDSEKVKTFQSHNFNLHQAKLKAVWADERLTGAVSEMTNLDQVKQNTDAAMSLNALTVTEFHELNRYAAQTAHQRCMGCAHRCESHFPDELKIAETLRYLMYAECYDKAGRARELYQQLSPVERAWQKVDLAAAEAACPQGISIRERLRYAEDLLA